MKRYRVTISDSSWENRSKVFIARSAEDAEQQADADDWMTDDWEVGRSNVEVGIDSIVEVKE